MPPLKNKRHEKFVQTLPKVKFNQTEAYLESFSTTKRKVAQAESSALLSKPIVGNRLAEVMLENGMNADYLHDNLKQVFSATKPVVYEGMITNEAPDYATRLEAIKFAVKVHGWVDKSDSAHGTINNTLLLLELPLEVKKKLETEIIELRRSLGHSIVKVDDRS